MARSRGPLTSNGVCWLSKNSTIKCVSVVQYGRHAAFYGCAEPDVEGSHVAAGRSVAKVEQTVSSSERSWDASLLSIGNTRSGS